MDVTAVGGLRFGTITAIPGGRRQGQQFAVAQDQTLEGTVVSIDHESVVIQVGGQRMRATTDASVRPGDVLRLNVRSTGPDQVLMQIVGRGGLAPVRTRSLTRQELAAELTRLGVAPDDESVQIAGELLARGQPLTAENVLDVRSALARAAHAHPRLAARSSNLPADVDVPVPAGPPPAEAPDAPPSSPSTAAERSAPRGSPDRPNMGGINQADLRAAVFLKAQGLPVTPAAVQIVRQAWSSGSALGQEVEQLRDGLASLAARLVDLAERPPARETPPLAPTRTAAVQVAGIEPELASQPARPEPGQPAAAMAVVEEAPPQPSRSVPSPGGAPIAPENQPLPANVRAAAVPAPPPPDDLPPDPAPVVAVSSPTDAESAPPAPPTPSLARLFAVVSESLGRLQVLDDEAVAGSRQELAARIQQVVADQGTPVEAKLVRVLEGLAERPAPIDRALVADLRTALADLVDEVQRQLDQPSQAARLPAETLRDLESVRQHAETILGRVELQQMTNAAPAPPGDPSYLIFQLPIPGGRDGQTAQIRIRQDDEGGAKRVDPKNVHVVFQFEMQNLGTVRVSLRVQERRVACQMGSTDEGATALLDRHAAELRQGLGELGYVVDDLRCAQLTPEDLRAPDAAVGAAPAARPSVRVDARA